MKKTLLSLLSLSFIAAMSLGGCGGNSSSSSGSSSGGGGNPGTDPTNPVTEEEAHFVKGTLHQTSVEETTNVFIKNKTSNYRIVYVDDSLAQKAASLIANHIYNATKCFLPTVNYDNYSPVADEKLIVLGVETLIDQSGIIRTTENIGTSGFQLETTSNGNVYIYTKGNFGYQQAAIRFLNETVGFDRFSDNIVTYTKSGEFMPKMKLIEKPDFPFHSQSNKVDNTTAYEMGFLLRSEVLSRSVVKEVHNAFDYLPKSKYQSSHPKWYSTTGTQLCYSARGDSEELEAMLDACMLTVKDVLAKEPNVGTLSLTVEDNADTCTCPACLANKDKYGEYVSSSILFMNKLDEKVQSYINDTYPGRQFNMIFFAYYSCETPPVKKDSSGNFLVDDNGECIPTYEEMKLNEHVGVYIAPIHACYTSSFYHKDNASAANNLKGWRALTKNIYYWLYETNYHAYLYPLDSYTTMIETYRYCVNNGATYMFNEGQHNQDMVTCFGKFKEYLNAKAEFDVNLKYGDIYNSFFDNYFGDASNIMKQYFTELQSHMMYLRKTQSSTITGGIYDDIMQTRFWPQNMLEKWEGMIDSCYNVIGKYKETNLDLYNALIRNIKLESIFPRFALLNHYRTSYNKEEMIDMLNSLIDDCNELNITHLTESALLQPTFESWLNA